ncbi:MAG TPA: cupredoxin domain-containing protein [Actinomycetota bacterium]
MPAVVDFRGRPPRIVHGIVAALCTVLLLAGAGCLGDEPASPGTAPSPTGLLERRDFGGTSAAVHGTLRVDTSNATVQMEDRYFEPNVLSGPPGLRVTLMVRNEGTQLHNFTLTSQGLAQDVPPGSIVAIAVELPASGEAVFFCRFHRDAGMLGALVAS